MHVNLVKKYNPNYTNFELAGHIFPSSEHSKIENKNINQIPQSCDFQMTSLLMKRL